MFLRETVKSELAARLAEHLPEALGTTWDTSAVLVMVESLAFKPASGHREDWQHRASFEGILRAEIRADSSDNPLPEMLAISLLGKPIFVSLPGVDQESLNVGDPRPKARLVFKDIRDSLRDHMVVSALRFEAVGGIYTYAPDPGRPDAGVAEFPDLRPDLGGAP